MSMGWIRICLLPMGVALLVSVQKITLAADYFPDDYGDASREGAFIASDGSTNTGIVEMDVDEDWFRFVALPGIAYKLEATASTIWDVNLELRGLDGIMTLAKANSSRTTSPVRASITWTNRGAAGSYYVGITPYLKFTTGTYAFAATPVNWADADQDGLPDGWETSKFLGLGYGADDDNDGDGYSNLREYYAGTCPTNRYSNMAIISFSNVNGMVSLRWSAVSDAVYGVKSATNLLVNSWKCEATNYCFAPTTSTQEWAGLTMETNLFYRIELMTNQ